MQTLLALLAALARFVVEWIKGSPSRVPDTADPERVRKLEEALVNEHREDLKDFDAKAAAVRDRADADRLLRDATGADDPALN